MFYEELLLDTEILKRIYCPVLSLAILGVFVSTILFAYIGHYLFSIDLLSSLLIVIAVAAMNIAAVETALRRIRIKKDILFTLIGESAFNDATAIVLVSVILGL